MKANGLGLHTVVKSLFASGVPLEVVMESFTRAGYNMSANWYMNVKRNTKVKQNAELSELIQESVHKGIRKALSSNNNKNAANNVKGEIHRLQDCLGIKAKLSNRVVHNFIKLQERLTQVFTIINIMAVISLIIAMVTWHMKGEQSLVLNTAFSAYNQGLSSINYSLKHSMGLNLRNGGVKEGLYIGGRHLTVAASMGALGARNTINSLLAMYVVSSVHASEMQFRNAAATLKNTYNKFEKKTIETGEQVMEKLMDTKNTIEKYLADKISMLEKLVKMIIDWFSKSTLGASVPKVISDGIEYAKAMAKDANAYMSPKLLGSSNEINTMHKMKNANRKQRLKLLNRLPSGKYYMNIAD